MTGFRMVRLGGVIALAVFAGVVGCSDQPTGPLPMFTPIEPVAAATGTATARPLLRTTPAAEYEQLLLVYHDLAASARVVHDCGVRDAAWSRLIATRIAAATTADDRLRALRDDLPPAQVAAITAQVARAAAAAARAAASTGPCRDLAGEPYVRRLDEVAFGTLDARDFYD